MWAMSEYDLRTRTTSSWRARSVGALDLELVLAHTLETGDAEHTAVDEPAQPAVSAVGIELVFVRPDRGEDAPASEVPLLDLVVVAVDVAPKRIKVRPQTLLHSGEPALARVVAHVDAALLEQIVLDLLEDERVDVALRFRPVWLLAGVEGDQLDVKTLVGCSCDRRLGHCRQACVELAFDGVLELVIGNVTLGLCVVALRDQVEERLARLVVGELLRHHLPADRLAGVDRREGVAEPGGAGSESAQGAQLLPLVRVPEMEPVARRLCDRRGQAALCVGLVDPLHQPETAAELERVARAERIARRILPNKLLPARAPRHQFVLDRHACAHSAAGGTSSTRSGWTDE